MNIADPRADLPYPVFYNFRRCPYAMRARLAIAAAGLPVELREIELSHKPADMLAVSPKGTVPVILFADGTVIEQSLDIMLWALAQHDPQHWLAQRLDALSLIQQNDNDFKYYLDRYKYADRYPEFAPLHYRQQGELFLATLEQRLSHSRFLCGNDFGLADAAILPFIRQFAAVDAAWFIGSPYAAVKTWLDNFLTSRLFAAVMRKYPPWKADDPLVLFGSEAIPGLQLI